LQGEKGDADRAVYAEGGYDAHEPHCFEGRQARFDIPADVKGIYYPKGLQQQERPESVCRSTMIRTLDHKLIRRSTGVNELYDMRDDPRELDNLYYDESYAQVTSKLEDRMLDWYVRTADAVPFDRDPRGLS
jgi:choline-sulfatase